MKGIPESQITQDWPKKWSVLKPIVTTLGGVNATYSTLNTWYTIRNNAATLLQADYTAPTDVSLKMELQLECLSDTALRYIEVCIMDTGLTVLSYGIVFFSNGATYQSITLVGVREFATDETTTIMGRIRLPAGSAQTATMIVDAAATQLILTPIVI